MAETELCRSLLTCSCCFILFLLMWRMCRDLALTSPTSSLTHSLVNTLRSPLAAASNPSLKGHTPDIQDSWIQGNSQDGFLNVEDILRDPKTTKDTLNLGNLVMTETPIDKIDSSHKIDIVENGEKHKPRVKSDLDVRNLAKNEDFRSVMNYNTHFKPHITKEIYNEGFTVERNEKCDREEKILFAIVVISAPDHYKQRDAIRRSWGQSSDRTVAFTFLVGISEDESVSRKVMQEAETHKDIVINKITDLYQNLSLKTLSAFHWMLKHCPQSQFLLKVDDDMFVQVEKLTATISTILENHSRPRLILGNISRGWKPVRNPKSKYLITEAQYPEESFPDFATGPSYLVSTQAAGEIYAAAMEFKYIHLEDVFLTGVVADSLDISRTDVHEFKNNAVRVPAQFMGCTIEKSFTIHKVEPEEQKELYQLSQNPNCGRPNKKHLALQTKKMIQTAINNQRHLVN